MADTTKFDPSADLFLTDVATNNLASPAIISLMIKQSKTDQERVGVKVFIGKTGSSSTGSSVFNSFKLFVAVYFWILLRPVSAIGFGVYFVYLIC